MCGPRMAWLVAMSDHYETPSPESPSPESPSPGDETPGLATHGQATPGPESSNVAAAGEQHGRPAPDVELSAMESRVLGALVEKSFLTPDVYPMTTNALVSACNQKTNRDPVVSFSAVEIDATLLELRQRNLVRRVHTAGARSTKHRQTLDEALELNERQLVLISVLLLRGAQTPGELRQRCDRHDVGFDDLDAIDACLRSLAERRLVTELARQPGQKENRWLHLLGTDSADGASSPDGVSSHGGVALGCAVAPSGSIAGSAAGSSAGASAAHEPATASPPRQAVSTSQASEPASRAHDSRADLGRRVEQLEAEVATLRRQLGELADKLGEPLDS